MRELIHGVEIVDPCRWLEDQESPETYRPILLHYDMRAGHAG